MAQRWEAKLNDEYVPRFITVPFGTVGGAAAADYDQLCFIANTQSGPVELVNVVVRAAVAGTDPGAVTLMVKKVPSGTSRTAGTDMLASGLDMKVTANTVQSGTLHATIANRQLAVGDAIGVVLTGTGTALDGVSGTMVLKRI